jgi:hypothetical protein
MHTYKHLPGLTYGGKYICFVLQGVSTEAKKAQKASSETNMFSVEKNG